MTNLLFAIVVSLSTNIAHTSNEQGCQRCYTERHGNFVYTDMGHHPCNRGPYREATEWTTTETVTERTNAVNGTLSFALGERVTRRTVTVERLKSERVTVTNYTELNPQMMQPTLYATNFGWTYYQANITNLLIR